MGKTGGDKMRAMNQARSAAKGQGGNKDEAEVEENRIASLKLEAERLRAELASERERVRALENVSGHVAERLNAAISP